MAAKKTYKDSDIVIVCEGFSATAGNFRFNNFDGAKIKSGEKYYTDLAVKMGAEIVE